MWTADYDPKGRTVWVQGTVLGPLGAETVNLILDTGTPVSVIDGLIGMDLLEGRIVTLDGVAGRLSVAR